MKENRKLLKEVLKDIRHDMTDEEVLKKRKKSTHSGSGQLTRSQNLQAVGRLYFPLQVG